MAESSQGRWFCCVRDGACLCSPTWVLVIHNDFEGIKKFNRQGDDVDVKNLRRVFETQRGCRFRELHNCGRKEIVQIFEQEERLIQLFRHTDDPLFCQPEAFILFILSHGDCGGVILTDHFMENTDPTDLKFETYNTKDVWNLAKMDFIAPSLKLLFLGPCRGNLAEFRLIDEDKKKTIPSLPGWLSSQPNKENFVILYATVETTMANRCEADGTWFVDAICKELENLTVNLPLLDFLTRIQFQLCARNTFGDANVGQTSQLHFFYHETFTMCASKRIYVPNRTLSITKRDQTDNILQRDDANSSMHWSDESNDAKAGNLEGLVKSFDKRFTYDWLDKNGIQLKRGKALIFQDTRHYVCAHKMGFALKGLGYATSMHDVSNINSIITSICPKRGLKNDGSFALCVLAQICETANGLIIKHGNKSFQLSRIIDEYTGTKCTQLIGKPKMFFFLDDRVMSDGEPNAENDTTIISSGYKYFNLHSGVCIFVGVRSGPKGSGGDVIENLVQALGSPELREKGANLQTVLSEVISKTSAEEKITEDDCNRIKPQFLSTLPQLVNFPTLKSRYEEEKYNSIGVFGAAVAASILLGIMIIVLGYLLRPPKYFLVNVDGSCGVTFTASDFIERDAFSLNSSEWSDVNKKCLDQWQNTYAAEYTVISLISSYDYQLAMQEMAKSDDVRKTLYRIVLFGYTSADILKWIQFSPMLNTTYLQNDFLQSVVSKIASNGDFQKIAVFELSRAVTLTSIAEISQNLIHRWTKSKIDRICQDMLELDYMDYESMTTLSADTREHFVPIITARCVPNATFKTFMDVTFKTKFDFPNLVCTAYQTVFMEMEKHKQLDSIKAFQLRLFSERYKTIPTEIEEQRKCIKVVEMSKLHFHRHAQPYLQMYDFMTYENNCSNYASILKNITDLYDDIFTNALDLVLPYMVEMRYNGSWENAEKIMKCIRDIKLDGISLTVLQALVNELKIYHKLTTLNALDAFSYYNYVLHESFNTSDVDQNILAAAPHWIQEFMFDCQPVCTYEKDQNCTVAVLQDLDLIIREFESRNLTGRYEILFIDFVLNSINNSAQMWQQVEALVMRVEPYKIEMLTEVVDTFLSYNITTGDDSPSMLFKYIGSKVLTAYLYDIVEQAYSIQGIQGLPQYIDNFEVIYFIKFNVCQGVYSLYSVMKQKIQNLDTIEFFFLRCFAYAVTTLPSFDSDAIGNETCEVVVNDLSNQSKIGMNTYEIYFRLNDSKSLGILHDWHKQYKYSLLWIVPQLISRLKSKNETFEFSILYLLKNMPSDQYLCLGFMGLVENISCDESNDDFCAYFKSQMCTILPKDILTYYNFGVLRYCTWLENYGNC